MKITFSNGNVYFEPGKFDDYDNYDDCYEQQEFQPVSYHDPNDGQITSQEPAIRDHEKRAENARNNAKDAGVKAGIGATTASGSAAAGNVPGVIGGSVGAVGYAHVSIHELRAAEREQKMADVFKVKEKEQLDNGKKTEN